MQETWVQSLGWGDPWRREQLPIPASWPGEFHGLYSPWCCKELDATEPLVLHFTYNTAPRNGFDDAIWPPPHHCRRGELEQRKQTWLLLSETIGPCPGSPRVLSGRQKQTRVCKDHRGVPTPALTTSESSRGHYTDFNPTFSANLLPDLSAVSSPPPRSAQPAP